MNIFLNRFRGLHGLTPEHYREMLSTIQRRRPLGSNSVLAKTSPRGVLPWISAHKGAGTSIVIAGRTYMPAPSGSPAPLMSPMAPMMAMGKLAIVPIPAQAGGGGSEHVGWFCAERPQAHFADTLIVPVVAATREGRVALPREFAASVEPGSTRAISAMAIGAPVAATAWVKDGTLHVRAGIPQPGREVSAVVARITGIRRGMAARWPRFTAGQATRNTHFYQQAFADHVE